jgi:hypothetical protein
MRISQFFLAFFVFAVLSLSVLALDYDVDPTFVPQMTGAPIYDMIILTDGKILVAGTLSQLNGTPSRFIGRLNADGTTDTPFSLPASGFGYVWGIKYSQTVSIWPTDRSGSVRSIRVMPC